MQQFDSMRIAGQSLFVKLCHSLIKMQITQIDFSEFHRLEICRSLTHRFTSVIPEKVTGKIGTSLWNLAHFNRRDTKAKENLLHCGEATINNLC